jgi:integrase
MHRVLSYAVRKKRLDVNPLGKANLPEGWSAPPAPEDIVDPRSVGGADLVVDMLTATSYIGRRQGPRFVAFYGCMFYAMMRPSEVIALTEDGCHLTTEGWGRLIFADTSPAAGRDFTNDGRMHEDRGLEGRPRQASARRATRNVPIPPELVTLLREHIAHFGTGEDGRLFRSENGTPSSPPPTTRSGPRPGHWRSPPPSGPTRSCAAPYDLRRSGITWRLNSGVPPTEIAAWAGYRVEMLLRVYARCVAGLEDVWIARMEATLRPQALRRAASPRLTTKITSKGREHDGHHTHAVTSARHRSWGAYGARRPATDGIRRRKVAKRPHHHPQHYRR